MRIRRLLLAIALLIGLCTAPAHAAATFPRIEASGFQLVAGDTFATYGTRIAALEQNPGLAPVGVTEVLAAANRTGRNLCHPTYLTASLNPSGFCWQDGEDDDENVWIPQGVTGSGDAQPGGGARRVAAATWHNGNDSAIRVSFLDLATNKYRHVLLVEPTSNGNFAAIAGHGHGMYWSGDMLIVATGGSVLRVFDLRHIWRTDTTTGEVGLGADGKSNGSFVAAEHTVRGGGRIVRWPVDTATGLPKLNASGVVQATEAFNSPVWGMQGAVSYGGRFVITGVCPEYADNIGDGVDYPSCLHRGIGGESTSVWTKAPKNTENLSYWPATNELWLLSEQLRERVTVHIPWS